MAKSISKDKLIPIIQQGDAVALVNLAQSFGTALADDRLSKSQIRNVFGEVRNIEASWQGPEEASDHLRRFLLLKPRMAYQGKRERKAEPLMTTLADAIDLAVADQDSEVVYQRFKYFAEFFEAILAYHTAAGGK